MMTSFLTVFHAAQMEALCTSPARNFPGALPKIEIKAKRLAVLGVGDSVLQCKGKNATFPTLSFAFKPPGSWPIRLRAMLFMRWRRSRHRLDEVKYIRVLTWLGTKRHRAAVQKQRLGFHSWSIPPAGRTVERQRSASADERPCSIPAVARGIVQ